MGDFGEDGQADQISREDFDTCDLRLEPDVYEMRGCPIIFPHSEQSAADGASSSADSSTLVVDRRSFAFNFILRIGYRVTKTCVLHIFLRTRSQRMNMEVRIVHHKLFDGGFKHEELCRDE
jgi:hypothetical protein